MPVLHDRDGAVISWVAVSKPLSLRPQTFAYMILVGDWAMYLYGV